MNRQQAPKPVVRPLPVLSSRKEFVNYIESIPFDPGTSSKIITALLRSFQIETNDGYVTPLVLINISMDGGSALYLQYCDINEQENSGHLVNGTNVTTSVLLTSLPCATGSDVPSESLAYVTEVIDVLVSEGQYYKDEILYEEKGFSESQRVDVIINF